MTDKIIHPNFGALTIIATHTVNSNNITLCKANVRNPYLVFWGASEDVITQNFYSNHKSLSAASKVFQTLSKNSHKVTHQQITKHLKAIT